MNEDLYHSNSDKCIYSIHHSTLFRKINVHKIWVYNRLLTKISAKLIPPGNSVLLKGWKLGFLKIRWTLDTPEAAETLLIVFFNCKWPKPTTSTTSLGKVLLYLQSRTLRNKLIHQFSPDGFIENSSSSSSTMMIVIHIAKVSLFLQLSILTVLNIFLSRNC